MNMYPYVGTCVHCGGSGAMQHRGLGEQFFGMVHDDPSYCEQYLAEEDELKKNRERLEREKNDAQGSKA